jgi:hypothetical protein
MKRTLLIGPGASGKTRVADKIAMAYNKENILVINGRILTHVTKKEFGSVFDALLSLVPARVELVIIDDVPKKHLLSVCEYFFNGSFTSHPQMQKRQMISPDIIVTCDCDLTNIPIGPSIDRRYEVMICEKNDPQEITLKFLVPDHLNSPKYLN